MKNAAANITEVFGNNVCKYVMSNCAGWVIDRMSDMSIVKRGPHTGKMECVSFAASDIGRDVLLSALRANR